MEYQCNHILSKGPRKGERCTNLAWYPFFFRCFCRPHAEVNHVPITYDEIQLFITNNT